MQITDTHIHLYSEEFDGDRTALIKSAIDKGITRMFMPNIDSKSVGPLLKITEEFPLNCFAMIGLHPCSVAKDYKEELSQIEEQLKKKKFVAIGEIGVDLYWSQEHKEEQLLAFESQLRLAKINNLPVVIHTRNAFDEAYEIINKVIHEEEVIFNPLRGIFHCFSGNMEQAQRAIGTGFKLGIGGVLTFKNSGLDKIVEEIDLKHLVLETDAPYLAPVPFRGKRNLPEYIIPVAEKLAEIKGLTIEEVARITTFNSIEVFGL